MSAVGLVLVNSTLCPAASAFTYFLLGSFLSCCTSTEPDLGGILNAALGGLVTICSGCNCVEPWAAMIIGMIAAFVYTGSSWLLKRLKIDDVIDASPVHYFCGMWGLIATGLFASDKLLAGHAAGLFYGGGDGHSAGMLLGWQIVGIVTITLWTASLTALIIFPLKLIGWLRLSEEEEKIGLDKMMQVHGLAPPTTPSYKSKTEGVKPQTTLHLGAAGASDVKSESDPENPPLENLKT